MDAVMFIVGCVLIILLIGSIAYGLFTTFRLLEKKDYKSFLLNLLFKLVILCFIILSVKDKASFLIEILRRNGFDV